MILNLKNKKMGETIANQQGKCPNPPKTYRDESKESREHNSQEHKEIKSHRQHQHAKKQVGNTALSTIQPTTNGNPQLKIKIKDPSERQTTDNLCRSHEKIDTCRLERVTSAYRKIKKLGNNEASYLVEDVNTSLEGLSRGGNKGMKGRRQLVSNVSRNHICTTEANDYVEKVAGRINASSSEMLQELLTPFLELFAANSLSERTSSHRELELKVSFAKNSKQSSRQHKKRSNQILIRDDQSLRSGQEQQNIQTFVASFFNRLDKARVKMDTINQSKKFKYVESPSITIFQKLYDDIEVFVSQFYECCFRQFDTQLQKCEETMAAIWEQKQRADQKYMRLTETISVEREKCRAYQNLACHYQQKNLYSTIFMNQLSFGMDIDSHLRQKLSQEVKKNGLASELSQSEVTRGDFEKRHQSGGELEISVYDNNENEFIGYRPACLDEGKAKRTRQWGK